MTKTSFNSVLGLLALILIAGFISSCSTLQVTSDYDKQVQFSDYSRFAFSSSLDELSVNDLVSKRIRSSIERDLKAKGFVLSDQPDFLVDVMVKVSNKEQIIARTEPLPGFYGRRYRFSPGWSSVTHYDVNTYEEGTLIIGMVDAVKNELVWEGKGCKVLSGKAPSEERIDKAVKQILKRFPPQTVN